MIRKIPHAGWKNNLRLRGRNTELVITLDVGPRVLRYAFHGQKNVFAEIPAHLGGSGEKGWVARGGHRLWTAPEAAHSYEPDNTPVKEKRLGKTAVEIIQSPGPGGFQKSLRVELLKNELVRVTHLLANVGKKPLTITPWALTIMAAGCTALIPQPRLDLHPDHFPKGRRVLPKDFLPNRELNLWPYTDLFDGRFQFSEHFLRVSQRPEKRATKIGLKLPTGWVACQNGEFVFAKHFTRDPALPYPDRGSNFELFTNHDILELETLAPLLPLLPGATRTHIEHWVLRKTDADLRGEKAALEFFASLPKIKAEA